MKSLFKALLGIIFFTLFYGCNDPVEEDPGVLHFYVTCLDEYGLEVAAEDVQITTKPETGTHTTDEFGSVVIRDLAADVYEIYLRKNRYESAKQIIAIAPGEGYDVSVNLGRKKDEGSVTVRILKPENHSYYSPGENIVFNIQAYTSSPSKEPLEVTISSDVDGVIYTGKTTSEIVMYQTSELTPNKHKITVKAEDSYGNTDESRVTIYTSKPNPVRITSAKQENNTVILQWEKSFESNFKKYEIYCSADSTTSGSLISTITSAEQTTFTDKEPLLSEILYYWVRVVDNNDCYSDGAPYKVQFPAGVVFPLSLKDAVHHPSQPVVYITDNESLSPQLHKINYQTNELSSVSLQGKPGYIDIGDNGFGLEIYVPSTDGAVYIYNANDLSFVKKIPIANSLISVATNGKGYFVAVDDNSWDGVISVNRATNEKISSTGFYSTNIRTRPNSNDMIGISLGISPTSMIYYPIDSNGKIEREIDDPYHGDHPLNAHIFRVAPTGEYSITSARGTVYSAAQDMTFKGNIRDQESGNYCDFSFSNDGAIIYGAITNSRSIEVVRYPDLLIEHNKTIHTRNYPRKLFNNNGKLVVIGNPLKQAKVISIELFEL